MVTITTPPIEQTAAAQETILLESQIGTSPGRRTLDLSDMMLGLGKGAVGSLQKLPEGISNQVTTAGAELIGYGLILYHLGSVGLETVITKVGLGSPPRKN